MDISILHYQFMQNAIVATLLGGIACGIVGVFVVTMRLSFIGVCLSHAAFAGAILGLLLGFEPLLGAFLFSVLSTVAIGALSDHGQLNSDTSIGVLFSLMLGLAFLFMGILPSPDSEALGLLWGSILTITRGELIILGLVTSVTVGLLAIFYKEIQAVLVSRETALAVGIPVSLIFYGLLLLTGTTVTIALPTIGGLLIFSLIINPAAAAYQLTYSLKRMFFLSALLGVLSGWLGLLASYFLKVPSGSSIIIISSMIFGFTLILSPKRKCKGLQECQS